MTSLGQGEPLISGVAIRHDPILSWQSISEGAMLRRRMIKLLWIMAPMLMRASADSASYKVGPKFEPQWYSGGALNTLTGLSSEKGTAPFCNVDWTNGAPSRSDLKKISEI